MDQSGPSDKQARVTAARMRLRERFLKQMQNTPALSDREPGGSGPDNRHGMPRLPPGQHETHKWPVLDLGVQPSIERDSWTLTLRGACAHPLVLDWQAFMELEQVDDISDFHCVTQWSRFDISWCGVRFADIAALAEPHEQAEYVMCHGYDGYTTNLSLVEALQSDVLLVYMADEKPLTREHGGPIRMITPRLYAWKGTKWIQSIEFMTQDRPGYWEQRGYSNTAHPWRNDRYSENGKEAE